jgi:SAM-dependent methyltransferase
MVGTTALAVLSLACRCLPGRQQDKDLVRMKLRRSLRLLRGRIITRLWTLTHPGEDASGSPEVTRCSSHQEFLEFRRRSAEKRAEMSDFEMSLLTGARKFKVPGYCTVCDMRVGFEVDYSHSYASQNGRPIPNWRERLVCPVCGLNNRMRAAAGFLKTMTHRSDVVYLTEQVAPLFRAVAPLYPHAIGSEFLRDGTPRGGVNANGIRNEDVTCLTFSNDSLDCIGTFDVLEHVPDYRSALAEFHRCLRPGGTLLMTVPFDLDLPKTRVRAVMERDGSIRHLHPPEYHGDPLSPDGVLCFYNFGWDFLDDMKGAGFSDTGLLIYWSVQFGHLGSDQFVIAASKPPAAAGA